MLATGPAAARARDCPARPALHTPAVDIPAELQQRIADVRDNSTPTDWVLASLSAESEGAAALRVVGSGGGGVNELRELLTQESPSPDPGPTTRVLALALCALVEPHGGALLRRPYPSTLPSSCPGAPYPALHPYPALALLP